MDALEFFDMNGDGKPELVVGQSDAGTMEYNAQTGAILWQNQSDHTQQITAGYILANSPTPQAVATGGCMARLFRALPASNPACGPPARRQLQGQAAAGFGRQQGPADQIALAAGWLRSSMVRQSRRLLERWPAHPLNGNPNFVRGDWYGNGKRTYFWFRFKLEPDGNGTLFFKGEAYHMFDFDHTGADQVITLEGGAAVLARVVPRRCASTATPTSCRTRRNAMPNAANSSPTTRTIEN